MTHRPPTDTRRRIERLTAAEPARWRVSIFLPTHRAGPETRQDPILFGNLIDEAERQLRSADDGLRESSATMLAEARSLLDDHEFWNDQTGGLAVFLGPEGTEIIRVPDDLEPRCIVNERFHLKPLLPRLVGDASYHVLALSRNDVRLLRCTRDTVEELPRGDIPGSLEDAVGHDVEQDSIQGHVQHRQGGPGQLGYHGRGKGIDDRDAELQSFLEKVDAAVRDRLASAPGPIVLAGVDEITAEFRKTSRMHARLAEATVAGNADRVSDVELHDASWPIVESGLDDPFERAREDFARLADGPRTTHDLETVLATTAEGRVKTLMVAIDEDRWGVSRDDDHAVELHDEQRPGDEDLVERAARLGRERGADVVFGVTQDMPAGAPLAAVLYEGSSPGA